MSRRVEVTEETMLVRGRKTTYICDDCGESSMNALSFALCGLCERDLCFKCDAARVEWSEHLGMALCLRCRNAGLDARVTMNEAERVYDAAKKKALADWRAKARAAGEDK